MGAPEAGGVEQLEKFLKGAAFGLTFKGARDDANDAFIDGGETDVGLIDQQQAALRLDDELGWRRGPARRFAGG